LTFLFCHPELVSGLFQGLQFEGVKKHPLNAPPKKIKTKIRFRNKFGMTPRNDNPANLAFGVV